MYFLLLTVKIMMATPSPPEAQLLPAELIFRLENCADHLRLRARAKGRGALFEYEILELSQLASEVLKDTIRAVS